MVEEDRALQGVQLRGVAARSRPGTDPPSGRSPHRAGASRRRAAGWRCRPEGARKTVERGERRHRFAVLDLGDVGARNVHARGQLALREVAHVTQLAHRSGDLQTFDGGLVLGDESQGLRRRRGGFDLEAFAAAAAALRWRCEIAPDCSDRNARPRVARQAPSWLPYCALREDPEQGPQHMSDNTDCDVPRVDTGLLWSQEETS